MDELALTAKESFQSEAALAARMAWDKETRDFEALIASFSSWIAQRRLTTSLIEPAISQGRPKKGDERGAILGDFGWTRSQWHRRRQELEISQADLHTYLDNCIERTRTPSLYGLLREVSETNTQVGDRCTCPVCQNVHLRKS